MYRDTTPFNIIFNADSRWQDRKAQDHILRPIQHSYIHIDPFGKTLGYAHIWSFRTSFPRWYSPQNQQRHLLFSYNFFSFAFAYTPRIQTLLCLCLSYFHQSFYLSFIIKLNIYIFIFTNLHSIFLRIELNGLFFISFLKGDHQELHRLTNTIKG